MGLADGIAWCQDKTDRNVPYSTAPSRFGRTSPIHFDCSGFGWSYCEAAGTPLPNWASVTYLMQQYGMESGLTESLDFARENEGLLVIHGGPTSAGGGPNGHMAVTDGQGGTYEAMGTRYGCRRGVVGNRFEYAMRPPGWNGTVHTGGSKPQEEEDDLNDEQDERLRNIEQMLGGEGGIKNAIVDPNSGVLATVYKIAGTLDGVKNHVNALYSSVVQNKFGTTVLSVTARTLTLMQKLAAKNDIKED